MIKVSVCAIAHLRFNDKIKLGQLIGSRKVAHMSVSDIRGYGSREAHAQDFASLIPGYACSIRAKLSILAPLRFHLLRRPICRWPIAVLDRQEAA